MRKHQYGLADKHIFLLIFALAVLIGAALWWRTQSGPAMTKSYASLVVYPQPKIIEPFTLQDAVGVPFTNADLSGRWTAISFGFATCPDICPTTLSELPAVFGSTLDQSVRVYFVSIDPERDTPAILQDYVQHFDPRFHAATSDVETLTRFAANLGAVFEKQSTGDGAMDYTMAHSATIFLINPDGHLAAMARPAQQSEFDWPALRRDVPAYLAAQGVATKKQGSAP